MKDYFKRLKYHPGLTTAFVATIFGTLVGSLNNSTTPLNGALFGFLCVGITFWSLVLISNFHK